MTRWVPWVRRFASLPTTTCRHLRLLSVEAAAHHANKTQVYVSRSNDPLLNLSVEHRLLQITPPESTILLLYVNSPCVVFGRNQNPWLEINLPRLAQIANRPREIGWKDSPVKLVRRRSGGGAVFHDLGNVNFSVICPPQAFDRDKHAEMVVRALKSLGRPTTSVNERHDIVIDVRAAGKPASSTFKISGSAYKLTRLRSLHHGTCLLRSPNLSDISGMLRSPAEPFVKARGVDSVRSPVSNANLDVDLFQDALVREFAKMYGDFDVHAEFDSYASQDQKMASGYGELQSKDWIYGQTPRFTFSTHPFEADSRRRPRLPFDYKIHFEARHGVIERFSIPGEQNFDGQKLINTSLHDISNWSSQLSQAGLGREASAHVGSWMDQVLGTEFTQISSPATI
ncbi:Biotin/lipoate A/B protein ligase [Metarhizium album ARSEF 1941]|uniref:Putative lipoate-protein ligase A n=1 Tax=Metarhizium album (strain ARSEF 1941) TaxID=1081103 RepID=A0A0B2WPU6_METAS|nr:Biotin/lipoate A/B protein ligase [Metarhizium album ARSEF 1941]KHN95507.1 Biotin/lipoate A/B protein ligase [Metarhizium album ARSEF 1941]